MPGQVLCTLRCRWGLWWPVLEDTMSTDHWDSVISATKSSLSYTSQHLHIATGLLHQWYATLLNVSALALWDDN
jgi:hypothetical protein